jgi:hypothetical protein
MGIMASFSLPIPGTLTDWIIFVLALVILWIIVSIPVYFAGKLVTTGESTFGDAMVATLAGGLVYFLVFYGLDFALGALLGSSALIFAFVLALLAWLAVYRGAFATSWLGALGIVVVAWLVLVILDAILIATVGVSIPKFYPF